MKKYKYLATSNEVYRKGTIHSTSKLKAGYRVMEKYKNKGYNNIKVEVS